MPAVCASVLDGTRLSVDGRVLRIDNSVTLGVILELIVADPADRDRFSAVQTSTSEAANRKDAALDDDVGMHLEFGRRFIFFYLRSAISHDTPPAPQPRRSVADVLMRTVRETRLPARPRSGPDGAMTALDRLQSDLIDWFDGQKLGFPADMCDSEGMYVVRSLGRALWCIDGHHSTLQSAVKHNGVSPLPTVWDRFDEYNDWRAKKLKKPQLSASRMKDHGELLLGMLGKSMLRTAVFSDFRHQVEALAQSLLTYAEYLVKAAAETATRQAMDHVVRPLSEFSDVEI